MNRKFILWMIVLFSMVRIGSSIAGEINWQIAQMPRALEQAKKQNTPLFVYWGAVWCPPCNLVKTTLFKDERFINATHDYISVYLDGDTGEAQKWGDKLQVRGYPTLMVLSPQGDEVLRLSPDNAVEDLVSTLNYAKNTWNPMTEVLDKVLSSEQVDAQQVKSLAVYSWLQDKEVIDQSATYADKLFRLDEALKHPGLSRESSRIFLTALSLKLESLSQDQQLEEQQKEYYKDRVTEILQNPRLLATNLQTLAYDAANLVSHLTAGAEEGISADRQNLIDLYTRKMRDYRDVKGISFDQFFSTFNPSVEFSESFEHVLDKQDQNQLEAFILANLPKTRDQKTRELMLNDASYMLFKFGRKEIARQLLEQELDRAKSPYYLMSTLGYFAKQEDDSALALEWYERAFKSARGPATKLQWYGSFVRNLINMKPQDKEAIKWHVDTLLTNYTHMPDSFWGRNYRVLLSIKKSVNQWAQENSESNWVEKIKVQGEKQCSLSRQAGYKAACDNFYREFI